MCPFSRLFALVAVVNFLMSVLAAQPVVDPSGHWEGIIQAPDVQVSVAIDLTRKASGEIAGTFTEPERGIKGLPLSKITLAGQSLEILLRPGQGGGTFKATLATDNSSMSGEFTMAEGGYVLPFSLSRTGEARIAPAPRSLAIDKELTGVWTGAVDVSGKSLRIVVTMTNHPDGTATGTIVSPDGSNVEIPIAMTQRAEQLKIEVPSVGSSINGTLNANRTELTGTWTQGAATLPIVLRRSAG